MFKIHGRTEGWSSVQKKVGIAFFVHFENNDKLLHFKNNSK